MELGLTGKRALVLGASRGLGRGIALALAAEGASVMIVGRNAERLEQVINEGQGLPGELIAETCDLAAAGAARTLADAARRRLGGVDVLVLNGGGPPPGPISAVDESAWRTHFDAMVTPLIGLTHELLPEMRDRGFGRVLLLASSGVRQPIPQLGISNTLRAGLAAWAKTLSLEVAADGVTVNLLLPGRIATERVAALDAAAAKREGVDVETIAARSRQTIPVGRYGNVEEFAAMAAFLASPLASYVTGAQIPIDGGLIKGL
ncbi:SDR family oxidoreductase [Halotalea alkalilenta]|uniref:3-oxoacyl-ACP reductase n=1 Tax=Halotalea alkalilenta TaxID=376489 RepID=A0A172YI36_9GAMM|nr:SDR family oxidoreductase [Halotalea alkalilenta]ANF58869.1 3-oxoacyl-ACP reductase [Halotalea alkalilenta]